MIILPTTSDKITLTTSSTANIECHSSYVDFTTSSATGGRKNTAVSSIQSTAEVVAAPAASTYRTVKVIEIANTHASTSNTVTVVHTDGTTPVSLFTVTLLAGWTLHYHERDGWSVHNLEGLDLTSGFTFPIRNPAAWDNRVVLSANVTSAAGANSIADVTGLSFAVTSGVRYWFTFQIWYTSSATSNGSRWSINGPTTTSLSYRSMYSLSATTVTTNSGLNAYDLPAATNNTTTSNLGSRATINGCINPSANGTLIARFASEANGQSIVAKAGSFVEWGTV